MGKIKEHDNAFKNNYHGILDHNGCIKVAGYDATGKIKYIRYDNDKIQDVLVKSGIKSYVAKIHKELLADMIYADVGDTAFVKFRKGKAYLTGFRKSKKHFVDNNIVIEGDETLLHYFQEQKRLSDVYDNGVMSYEQ